MYKTPLFYPPPKKKKKKTALLPSPPRGSSSFEVKAPKSGSGSSTPGNKSLVMPLNLEWRGGEGRGGEGEEEEQRICLIFGVLNLSGEERRIVCLLFKLFFVLC